MSCITHLSWNLNERHLCVVHLILLSHLHIHIDFRWLRNISMCWMNRTRILRRLMCKLPILKRLIGIVRLIERVVMRVSWKIQVCSLFIGYTSRNLIKWCECSWILVFYVKRYWCFLDQAMCHHSLGFTHEKWRWLKVYLLLWRIFLSKVLNLGDSVLFFFIKSML